jgi:hypothetical protein
MADIRDYISPHVFDGVRKLSPEAYERHRKAMVGLFAKLTPEQQKRALEYRGPDC